MQHMEQTLAFQACSENMSYVFTREGVNKTPCPTIPCKSLNLTSSPICPYKAVTLWVANQQHMRDEAFRVGLVKGAITKCTILCSDMTNLVDKGMVHEVRAANAEVEHVDLL